MSLTIKATWAIALAAYVTTSAFAQPAIRVEESTSSVVRRGENEPIDIQIRKRPVVNVIDPDVSITKVVRTEGELTFRDLRVQVDRVEGKRQDDKSCVLTVRTATTSQSLTLQEFDTEFVDNYEVTIFGIQPSDAGNGKGSVRLRVAATRFSTDKEIDLASREFDAPPPTATLSKETDISTTTADYLPPASYGTESVIMRGGQEIPLRPELLSSATLAVTVPDVFQTTLTNGIRFYHYENHDLPRVRVTFLVEAGKNADPADRVGLAEITARTMRSGGAAGKSGDEIDRLLEQIGSDLEFAPDYDNVAGSLFALTDKADEAMALLTDVLLKPEFDEKKLEQQRARALEELRRQNDQPDLISRREFRKIIYGPEHPLARIPTSSSISAITRDDVRAFHDARYRPSSLWVGISGDISQADARKLVETAFGAWDRPAAEEVPTPVIDVNYNTTGGVFLSQKATAQSQIRLGHLGMSRRSPQVYAANVLNSIYGTGGFSSRLMNTVRTKHGYVYGVGGGIFSDDPAGLFAAVAASKSGTTAAAIKEILSVTQSVIDGPISEQELETARRDIVFTFVNQFDTAAETIATYMLYDYRGYAPDYLKTFPERVRAVTAEDVKAVASELLHPDQIKIYVIGNESEMDAPLSGFGAVQQWALPDYSGN